MNTPAFAIVCTAPIYCPDTDGIMGQGSFVYERHLTKRAADTRCAALSNDENYIGEMSFHVEMRPFREGEDKMPRPMYSLIELACDARASAENCPEWAR
jgi:hypothetical protein